MVVCYSIYKFYIYFKSYLIAPYSSWSLQCCYPRVYLYRILRIYKYYIRFIICTLRHFKNVYFFCETHWPYSSRSLQCCYIAFRVYLYRILRIYKYDIRYIICTLRHFKNVYFFCETHCSNTNFG